jgi:hypothetical protein
LQSVPTSELRTLRELTIAPRASGDSRPARNRESPATGGRFKVALSQVGRACHLQPSMETGHPGIRSPWSEDRRESSPGASWRLDNIAKGVLDALGGLLGWNRSGLAADERVHHLEVLLHDNEEGEERTVIELHDLRKQTRHRPDIPYELASNGSAPTGTDKSQKHHHPAPENGGVVRAAAGPVLLLRWKPPLRGRCRAFVATRPVLYHFEIEPGMVKSPKRALPRISQPYELVKALLGALASGPKTSDQLDLELESASAEAGKALRLDEVDAWLQDALGLVKKTRDGIVLTEQGSWLAEAAGTPAFDCRFLQQLLARGATRFRYFNDAHGFLIQRRNRGETSIPVQELNIELSLTIANKTSGPIIRRLLVGLGVLNSQGDSYQIDDICGDGKEVSPELRALMSRAEQLISMEALSYEELCERLAQAIGDEAFQQLKKQFRDHLRIAPTRAIEWVVGVKWPEEDSF